MNSLFSEFFTKFSGVVLEVCETIWRLFGGHVGGVLEGFRGGKQFKQTRKIQNPYFLLVGNSFTLAIYSQSQTPPRPRALPNLRV